MSGQLPIEGISYGPTQQAPLEQQLIVEGRLPRWGAIFP